MDLVYSYIQTKRRGLQVNVLDCCSYMIPSCSGPYITLWIMSWAGSLMIWSWSGLFMNSHNYFPDHPVNVLDCFSYDTILFWTIYDPVNNVPDHSWNALWMSWTGSAMIRSWSGLFRLSRDHFPDHPVNVLDCFSYDTILFWTIYDPVNNVLDHSWNVLWMSWVGSTTMWSWSRVFINSHNHFPDHPAMSWTVFHMTLFCPGPYMTLWTMSWAGSPMIWSWSRLFMNSHNHFPDYLVNVLDCCSYDTILSWTILEMCCKCAGLFFFFSIMWFFSRPSYVCFWTVTYMIWSWSRL